MAHKKAAGSTSNLKDSNAQRLGVKLFGGQYAKIGSIIIRQRGSEFRAGEGVKMAKDDTLFAITSGIIQFTKKKIKRFDGALKFARFINITTPKTK
jgi:large subunit ribosomal protein L27